MLMVTHEPDMAAYAAASSVSSTASRQDIATGAA
jgi:hypothetical protein